MKLGKTEGVETKIGRDANQQRSWQRFSSQICAASSVTSERISDPHLRSRQWPWPESRIQFWPASPISDRPAGSDMTARLWFRLTGMCMRIIIIIQFKTVTGGARWRAGRHGKLVSPKVNEDGSTVAIAVALDRNGAC